MDSIYGNEWKNREKDLLSADQISRMKIVQNASPPLVLNVAHWNCFSPWHVPFRKITDNLLLFIESGEFIVRLAHRELRLYVYLLAVDSGEYASLLRARARLFRQQLLHSAFVVSAQ